MPDKALRRRRERFPANKIRRVFDRIAPSFATHDFLFREMSRRMDERLDVVRITPERILDTGCGLGADRLALLRRYPASSWVGVDQSIQMLRYGQAADQASASFLRRLLHSVQRPRDERIAANLAALPVAGQSVDLIWSNAMLHWLDDLPAALAECHRVLRVGGLLMFSTLGPDTLRELRAAMHAADTSAEVGEPAHGFTDMHDIGDMLVDAGFADPVMDMETLTLTYADPWQALRELQQAGSLGERIGLTARGYWQRVFAHWPQGADGRYTLTFELIQGHAWKVLPRQHEDGRAIVNFMPRPGQQRQG